MAFDEHMASRIRSVVGAYDGVTEKKMFGGLAFLLDGNMWCGVNKDNVMFRIGSDRYEEALQRSGAREMDFTGRPLRGFVYVDAEALDGAAELADWIEYTFRFVSTLPAKK